MTMSNDHYIIRYNVNGVQEKVFGSVHVSRQNGGCYSLLEEETRNLIPLSCYRDALDLVDNRGDEKVGRWNVVILYL